MGGMGMRFLFCGFGLLVVGCSGVPVVGGDGGFVTVRSGLVGVRGSAVKVAERVAGARAAVGVAEERVSGLVKAGEGVGTKARGVLVEVQGELKAAGAALEVGGRELGEMKGALVEAEVRVKEAEERAVAVGERLATVEQEARRERVEVEFWRAVALKLGVLTLGMAVWVFRRPIGALLRVPLALA